jgi:hypothetical protein
MAQAVAPTPLQIAESALALPGCLLITAVRLAPTGRSIHRALLPRQQRVLELPGRKAATAAGAEGERGE